MIQQPLAQQPQRVPIDRAFQIELAATKATSNKGGALAKSFTRCAASCH